MKPSLVIGCTLIVVIAGCSKAPEPAAPAAPPAAQPVADAADTIYTGGDIVTVDDRQPGAEALAVKGGKIVAVGTRAEVEKAHKGANTKVADLGGKALLPGFLDAHSHYISSLSVANQVSNTWRYLAYLRSAFCVLLHQARFRRAPCGSR